MNTASRWIACVHPPPPLKKSISFEVFFEGRGRLHRGYSGERMKEINAVVILIVRTPCALCNSTTRVLCSSLEKVKSETVILEYVPINSVTRVSLNYRGFIRLRVA